MAGSQPYKGLNKLIKIHGDPRGLKTAVICTLDPKRIHDADRIKDFAKAGMRVVRLNLSHVEVSDRERAWGLIEKVREAEIDLGRPIGIMIDLRGPRLRVGQIESDTVEIKRGNRYTFRSNNKEIVGNDEYCSVSSEDFFPNHDFVGDVRKYFKKYDERLEELRTRSKTQKLSEREKDELREREEGFFIYINDGRLKFKVERVDRHDVHCKIVRGGNLEIRKGVNVPDCVFGFPAVTPKDFADLRWIFEQEAKKRQHDDEFVTIDFIAQSFVKSKRDVERLRDGLAPLIEVGREIPLIAKLETQEALDNLDEIMEAADGAMVARGDLAVEISMEKVPKAQREIIGTAGITYGLSRDRIYNKGPKFVIVATQMIEGMIQDVQPLRAEVADINYAILEGTDAIMTSAETIKAEDPIEVVKRMVEIAQEAENEREEWGYRKPKIKIKNFTDIDNQYLGLAESACILAENRNSAEIVVSTYSGRGAKILSSFKPRAQIIALTTQRRTVYNLLLYSGICPVLINLPDNDEIDTESYLDKMRNVLHELGLDEKGDEIVGFFGIQPGLHPLGPDLKSNTIRLFEI